MNELSNELKGLVPSNLAQHNNDQRRVEEKGCPCENDFIRSKTREQPSKQVQNVSQQKPIRKQHDLFVLQSHYINS